VVASFKVAGSTLEYIHAVMTTFFHFDRAVVTTYAQNQVLSGDRGPWIFAGDLNGDRIADLILSLNWEAYRVDSFQLHLGSLAP